MKLLLVAFALTSSALAETNLVPNCNFSDPTPLKHWRVDFPYQDWYVKNAGYVKPATAGGKRCAVIELPPGIAGNEGGKIETALIPAEPGATYKVEVQCMTWDFSAKLHAEAYAPDPRPDVERKEVESKGRRVTIARIPPIEGRPALVQIYRAQLPDAPSGSKQWEKVGREFTLPKETTIAGLKVAPAFLVVKAFAYGATPKAGKSYFTDFKLVKVK